MTSSHPAGGSRTLIGILSTFALVGGVVGFQNAALADQQAAEQQAVVEAPAPAAPAAEPPPAPAHDPVPAPPSGTTGGSGG